MRAWLTAVFAALSLIAAPTPASAQTEADLRALIAWTAPLNDIQTRAQDAVRSVTGLTTQMRAARTPEEVEALLRAAQPTIVATRAQLRALRVEADAIQPFTSTTMDQGVVALTNIALADTKTTLDLFEGAIADIEQMLPAIERRDAAALQRIAGRLVLFAANFLRSQASSMRLGQLQMPITDPGHHIMGAHADLIDGLYAMLTISTATDTSAITAAVQRARSSITAGRGMLAAQRAVFAAHPQGASLEPLMNNAEQQLTVLTTFANDLESATTRISPRTPIQELIPMMRAVAENDRRLQVLGDEGASLAAQLVRR